MELVHDYVHPTTHGGRCRVRLYLPEKNGDSPVTALHSVVILTELPENDGMSITNAASELAGEILTGHGFEEIPLFIEHYPAASHPPDPETFDILRFEGGHLSKHAVLRRPTWRLGRSKWKPFDRERTEALIGQPVED